MSADPQGDLDEGRRISDEIRAQARELRARGVYTEEDLRAALRVRRLRHFERGKIDPRLGRALLHTSHDWNVDPAYAIRSHRGGVAGAVLPALKRLIAPLVRLYTDHVVLRQAQINLAVHYAVVDLLEQNERLAVRVRSLEARVRELEAGQR